MKLTLTRMDLLEGLKKIAQVMNTKNDIQMFNNILLTINNNVITLTGGDADKLLVVTVNSEDTVASTGGSILLNYKQLNDFIRKSKAKKVTIEQKGDNQLSIKAGNISYDLSIYDVDDYPILPELSGSPITLNIDDYVKAVKNTANVVAKSDSRPILKGVCIEVDEESIKFVSTDSHRLGRYIAKINNGNVHRNVIDGRCLEKTLKLISNNTINVHMVFDKEYSKISFDEIELYMRNYEGNYPDTNRLIPDSYNSSIELNSHEVLTSLSQLEVLSKADRNNVVMLTANDTISISAKNPVNGNMIAELNGVTHGKDIVISFSNDCLAKAIKALDNNYIKLSFTGTMRPFVVESNDGKAMQLILPVRTY